MNGNLLNIIAFFAITIGVILFTIVIVFHLLRRRKLKNKVTNAFKEIVKNYPILDKVSFRYINIQEIKDQYQTNFPGYEVKLKEIVESQNEATGGKLGIDGIGGIGHTEGGNTTVKTVYKAERQTLTRIFVELLAYYFEEGIVSIETEGSPVDVQVSNVENIREAASTLEKYGISVSEKDMKNAERELLIKEVKKLAGRFREGRHWVVIESEFLVNCVDNIYTYVMQHPITIQLGVDQVQPILISFQLNVKDMLEEYADQHKRCDGRRINLRVFGEMTANIGEKEEDVDYSIRPFAVF